MALEAFTNEKQASVCPYEEPYGTLLAFRHENCKSTTKGGHVFLMTYPDLRCQNTLTTHYRHITTADTRQMHMHYTIRNKKGATPALRQASRLKYITL
jgi:hypothetical protein